MVKEGPGAGRTQAVKGMAFDERACVPAPGNRDKFGILTADLNNAPDIGKLFQAAPRMRDNLVQARQIQAVCYQGLAAARHADACKCDVS